MASRIDRVISDLSKLKSQAKQQEMISIEKGQESMALINHGRQIAFRDAISLLHAERIVMRKRKEHGKG